MGELKKGSLRRLLTSLRSAEHFTLIGRPALVFVLVNRFNAAGHIKSVFGRTLDGKNETRAREADVVFTDHRGAPVSRQEALKRGEAWADIDIPALVRKGVEE